MRRRVLVDLLFYTGRKGGMESYAREVYSRLSPADPDFEYIAFASSELASADTSWFPGRVVDSGISGEDRIAWARGELFAVARRARHLRAELIHCPANFGPWRSRVPVVLTVQDLLAFRHPEWVPGSRSRVVRSMIRVAARRARRILTISRATYDDLVSYLGIPPDRIDVIPLAASADAGAAPIERLETQLLAVGNRMPHKGFETLIESIALIEPERRPTLVVTGSHGDDPLAPLVERLGLREFVHLRGWLSDLELDRLYRESTALVFPTRFEGFGLPTLEAMARGCPTILSDLPVLHEVAGDAALYVDPFDPRSIADAIRTVIDSADLRERMSRAGLERASGFSWDRTAAATRASFRVAVAVATEDLSPA
jgi:glycosyltransferase involved in cell wall biosynthesis